MRRSVAPQALLWRMGLVYVGAIFLTYFSLGLGLLGFASALGQTHWVGRAAALGAVAFGLLALQEALVPEWGVRMGVPAALRGRLQGLTSRASGPAVFGAGVLVGLCTVPCSGAVYLAVLGLLASQSTLGEGAGYLLLYNAIFVLPLPGLLAFAGSRPVFNPDLWPVVDHPRAGWHGGAPLRPVPGAVRRREVHAHVLAY